MHRYDKEKIRAEFFALVSFGIDVLKEVVLKGGL